MKWSDYVRDYFAQYDVGDMTDMTMAPDDEQLKIIARLDGALTRLCKQDPKPSLFARLLGRINRSNKSPSSGLCGIYLWGGVGSGKTLILEAFYHFLTQTGKKSGKAHFHFHRFMRMVHQKRFDIKDAALAFNSIANEFKNHVVFLDEFFVNDIGDAMLLKGMLEAFHKSDTVILITSNTEPDGLYAGGLQRERFLPAIDFIKSQFEVIELSSAVDYRARMLRATGTYHTPCDDAADKALRTQMKALSIRDIEVSKDIVVGNRTIPTVQLSSAVAWFSFKTLCETNRAAGDYIRIANEYPSVLMSGVANMDGRDDVARRFIYLIDVLYEHHVKLIISAEVTIDNLYGRGKLSEEFERTVSRLLEINSEAYLSALHKPSHN